MVTVRVTVRVTVSVKVRRAPREHGHARQHAAPCTKRREGLGGGRGRRRVDGLDLVQLHLQLPGEGLGVRLGLCVLGRLGARLLLVTLQPRHLRVELGDARRRGLRLRRRRRALRLRLAELRAHEGRLVG